MASFADNLISGSIRVTPRMSWWIRHGTDMSRYIQKWRSKRKVCGKTDRDMVRETMIRGAVEWNDLVYRTQKPPLMTEHVELELALVDRALGLVEATREMERISDFLMENIERQAAHCELRVEGFPTLRWKELLCEHVKLFAESLRWFATPSEREYAACEERRAANSLALSTFSTEWL